MREYRGDKASRAFLFETLMEMRNVAMLRHLVEQGLIEEPRNGTL